MGRKNDINFDYNSEVKKCKTIDDVLGKNGLVQRLVKDVLWLTDSYYQYYSINYIITFIFNYYVIRFWIILIFIEFKYK